jgi:photosystem II stability/assembly factor-like uncharacterized protein
MRFLALRLVGLIFGLAPVFFYSYGASFKEPALNENLYGVEIDGARVWIVGYYGTILHSPDRGQSWQIQSSPTRKALYTVRFTGLSTGWITGSSGTLLHTADGGKTWNSHALDTSEHLFASHWLDKNHGWLAGTRGVTFRTVDGGRSWTKLVIPGDYSLSAITFTDRLRGWLAGEFGAIFRSEDGGASWTKQKSPVEVSFDSGASQNLFTLLFTGPSRGYAFGLDGIVLQMQDNSGWKIARQRENNHGAAASHLFAAAAFQGRILAVGERGTLVQADEEAGWRAVPLDIPRLSLNAITFGADGLGIIAGNRGLVLRTLDGGETWARLRPTVMSKDGHLP